jgi:HEAT repeat protein
VLVLALLLRDRQERREERWSGLRALSRIFRAAGRRLGLKPEEEGRLGRVSIAGEVDGAGVSARCMCLSPDSLATTMTPAGGLRLSPGPWATTVTVTVHRPLLQEMRIESRWRPSVTTLPERTTHSSEVATGDHSFDQLLAVSGRAAFARAFLSKAARDGLAALARRATVSLEGGRLTCEWAERPWSADALVSLVRETLAAAAQFPQVSDVPASLAQVARADPAPGVRAACLTTLLSEYAEHPLIPLEAALDDDSDAVRVVAATALGDRGTPVLLEIAARPSGAEAPTAKAIAVLRRRLPTAEAIAILDAALHGERKGVALAAIASLGRTGDEHALARLQAVLRDGEEDFAAAAARAVGEMRSPAAEAVLISALESPWPEVRRAAIRALAESGGPETVSRLCLLLESAADRDVADEIRTVIAAIRARLPGASPGQVSLAEGESGRVSYPEADRAGRVSLPAQPQAETSSLGSRRKDPLSH